VEAEGAETDSRTAAERSVRVVCRPFSRGVSGNPRGVSKGMAALIRLSLALSPGAAGFSVVHFPAARR
jgi:hypothetical protein